VKIVSVKVVRHLLA